MSWKGARLKGNRPLRSYCSYLGVKWWELIPRVQQKDSHSSTLADPGRAQVVSPWGLWRHSFNLSSVQFSYSVMWDSLWPHESQHARPPCPSPTPGVHSDSRPLSQWCHPVISSSVVPFSSCPQSLPASESFPMSQLFEWDGQSTGVSALASFLPKKSQGGSPSECTGWISQESSPTPHFKSINS